MSKQDIILSGPSCAGKTTLADRLADEGWTLVAARAVLAARLSGERVDRAALQALGAELEAAEPGGWLAAATAAATHPVVVDSARTSAQLRAVRIASERPLHVHVLADEDARRARFDLRTDAIDAATAFDTLAAADRAQGIHELAAGADMVLDSTAASPLALAEQILDLAR